MVTGPPPRPHAARCFTQRRAEVEQRLPEHSLQGVRRALGELGNRCTRWAGAALLAGPVMLARVLSACLAGVEAALVRVEVDVSQGLPTYATVGLPDTAVRESRERVRTAIRNFGFAEPLGARHRQSRAGGRAEGRRELRSADRAWAPGGDGGGQARPARAAPRRGGACPRRGDPPRARRAPHGAPGESRGARGVVPVRNSIYLSCLNLPRPPSSLIR